MKTNHPVYMVPRFDIPFLKPVYIYERIHINLLLCCVSVVMMQMDRSKLYGGVVAAMILCATACSAYPQPQQHQQQQHEQTDMTESVEEVPQRPATLKNGYHPGLFPFNKGEPFVMDPNLSSVTGFNTKPPPPPAQPNNHQRADDEYYDYDAKLEEVPYDYKGDPIDRKDVLEPKLPRPNDIKPASNKNKLPQEDIYQFLNLPVKYSSSDYKFPLMSSSYANTKVQGSGSSSLLSNHKMPSTVQPSSAAVPSTATPTTSWYNPVKTTAFKPMTTTTTATTTTTTTTSLPTTTTTITTTTPQPTTTISTSRPTTTTTTANPPPQQEYEDDYYDYFHSQDPVPETSSTVRPSTTTIVHRNQPPSIVTPEPVTTTTTTSTTAPKSTTTTTTVPASTASATTEKPQYYTNPTPVTNKTTTARPEIDSKLDGTSFADYDTIKSPPGKEQSAQKYGQNFKPLPAGYPFDDKTYPLITNGKVPMTFTAHVSSGISLNQKEHGSPSSAVADHRKPSTVVSEPVYSSRPQPQPEVQRESAKPVQEPMYDDNSSRLPPKPVQESVYDDDSSRLPSGGKPNPSEPSASASATTYSQKPRPSKPAGTDQFETVYYKVRPDGYPQQFPGRPVSPPVQQSRPTYQPEPSVQMKPHPQTETVRKPAVNAAEQHHPALQPQGRPPQQPYHHLAVQSEVHTKNKPQYVPPPQSQPDTSRFKPPKHVINHFIKTLPTDDNKSYALQTSFSIGMDGERTAEARPAQGIGQVLMVEDSSSSETTVVDQTIPPMIKLKPTTSVPLVPPPRLVQKPLQQSYPRPQWENVPKPPQYYPSPKRDNIPPPPPPPPQRTNLPNILPQFRPNAKVDTPPMVSPPSHSATIERVQMPMDHLRPPPLPKPQFLKLDRNDDNADEEILDIPEKETRILQRTGPQPAKVTTLQMIQHGPSSKIRDDNQENPVHIVYAANAPPKPVDKLMDDSVILDVNDRSDVPILKTKTVNNKPVKTDFPYQIVKPDENQNASSLEYQAYSPTKSDPIKPNHEQDLVPNLQDYVPVTTREPTSNNNAMSQKTIAATLKTSEDNHRMTVDEGNHHKPQLQNFQIPFQPSLKLPENSNGWSVIRKSQTDNASDRMDETTGDVDASTEKFDPDNFKPQLVGGFLPISPPFEEDKDEKTVEQSERAKKSIKD